MSFGVLAFAASVGAARGITAGWSAEEAVQELNSLYMAFNESDDSTALGVSITFPGQMASLESNLFCSGYTNSVCFSGTNDCRMSTAHINHKVMVQKQGDGWKVQPLMGRGVGIVFNHTLTENYFGKCTYLYDGASSFNVNVGCGGSAPVPQTCENPNSAFYNMCTDDGGNTYHHCTATDPEVTNKKCKGESGNETYGTVIPPRFKNDETCFYEMPALIVPHDDPSSFTPSSTNHLRDAMKQRVLGDSTTGQTQEWNEVIIDEKLLIPQIQSDPTHTILAFVYLNGAWMWDQEAKRLATNMRNRFQETYGVVGEIPLLELDAMNEFTETGGPFKLPSKWPPVVIA